MRSTSFLSRWVPCGGGRYLPLTAMKRELRYMISKEELAVALEMRARVPGRSKVVPQREKLAPSGDGRRSIGEQQVEYLVTFH